MLSWFKNRVKGGSDTKYKFKQRKKDSWRNITTLLNQDGVPGGGASSSPNSPLFNRFEQSSNISTGRRPHSLSEDSDNSAASTANRSGVSNKTGSSTTSTNTKTVRFKLSLDSKRSLDSKVSFDSTRAYLNSFDSGGDTCSEKSFTEEKIYKKLDSKKIDQLQSALYSVRITPESDGESKSDEGSDANSGVNSNHSSEESGHTVNSSGLGSSIMDGSSSGSGAEHRYDKNGRYSLSGSYDSNGKNVGSKCGSESKYDSNSRYTHKNSKYIPKSQYYSENKYRSPAAWTDSKYDSSSGYNVHINTSDKNSSLSHSKSVKIKPAITPQIRQVKLQRHKSTIGSHSNIRARGSVKKSSSISYKISSENPNGASNSHTQNRTTGAVPDVRTLYEQRLKQFQQQNPSMDPTRKVLTRNMSRINSNPTQHHINLVRTMSTNAKIKTNFRDEPGCNSVLYA